jgi:hypothetical protein
METVQVIKSGRRLPTDQECALLATGLDLTAGRPAELLRAAVRQQASGIQAFG